MSMICGSDGILAKPTNDNGKIANDSQSERGSRLRAYPKVNMDNVRPDQATLDPSPSQLSGYILVCFRAQAANHPNLKQY